MAVILNGTTNDITINGASVATDAEVSSAVAPLATTAYVDGKFIRGTAVATTSGTSIDFTGIPSWVKRITVILDSVSTSGASFLIIQLGSTTFTTTNYASSSTYTKGGAAVTGSTYTNGFGTYVANASALRTGTYTFTNIQGNIWVESGVAQDFNDASLQLVSGRVTLSGVLDRIRLTTANGTDIFDAGQINIMYEG